MLKRHPQIASALQDITKQCVSLAKQGCAGPDQEASGEDTTDVRRKLTPTPQIIPEYDIEEPHQDPLLPQVENATLPSAALTQWSDLSMPLTPPYQEQAVLPFGIVLESSPIPLFTPIAPSPNPPAGLSPDSLAKLGRWTLSHRLVRECSQNGYRLLLNSANDTPKIIEIFGAPLSAVDRNRLLSGFCMTMNDDAGDLVELKTRVLDPMKLKLSTLSPDMVAHAYRVWQVMLESGGDGLLDANGVQRLLQERGVNLQDNDSATTSLHPGGLGHFNASAFVKCEFDYAGLRFTVY